jgi:hypothetical protein
VLIYDSAKNARSCWVEKMLDPFFKEKGPLLSIETYIAGSGEDGVAEAIMQKGQGILR